MPVLPLVGSSSSRPGSSSTRPPVSVRSVGGMRTRLTLPLRRERYLSPQPSQVRRVSDSDLRRKSCVCPYALAELDVVDVLRDRGRLPADGARRVAADLHLGEGGRERVDEEEAAHERLADPERQLERLARLALAHYTWLVATVAVIRVA